MSAMGLGYAHAGSSAIGHAMWGTDLSYAVQCSYRLMMELLRPRSACHGWYSIRLAPSDAQSGIDLAYGAAPLHSPVLA